MAEPLQQQQQQQQRQQQQQPAVPLPASPLLPDAVDMHHRAFFSFEPSLLLADLGNIALDYCISGIHQLERAIHESPLFQQQADEPSSSLAPNCPQVQQQINAQLHQFKAAASEVLAEVQRRMAEGVSHAVDNFERYEAVTNLHVPPELYLQQAAPVLPEAVDEQQEAALDAELQQLRQQVTQARAECWQLKQQLAHMEADINTAAARSAAFKPLADVVGSSAGPLLREAAAISSLSAKLQPMVARAQALAADWDGPVGGALADASNVAGGRASRAGAVFGLQRGKVVSFGAATRGVVSAGAGSAHPQGARGGGVEQQVRQLMAETGASLAELGALNASLAAGGGGDGGGAGGGGRAGGMQA